MFSPTCTREVFGLNLSCRNRCGHFRSVFWICSFDYGYLSLICLFHSRESEQGRLSVLIIGLKDDSYQRRPAIVFLHSSFKYKEWLRQLIEVAISLHCQLSALHLLSLFFVFHQSIIWTWNVWQAYASRGYICIAVDCLTIANGLALLLLTKMYGFRSAYFTMVV